VKSSNIPASKKKNNVITYPFWFGGSSSSLAACVTHPLDLIKVRLQTQQHGAAKKNMVQMFSHVVKTDGYAGLYKGLSASLLRQLTYSTVRFGIYEKLKEGISQRRKPSLPQLIAISSTAGFFGGIAGNPADVLNVRMQHDRSLPPEKQRRYKHAIDGLMRMTREEGVASLWRGVWPNSMRAALMTASQLASYDAIKSTLITHTSLQDNTLTYFISSFLAGFVATTICSPVDVIKTRIMSASETEGITKLLTEIYRNEGAGWMFRGWVPSFIRLGPHTIATFLFLEQHRKMYRFLRGIDEPL